MKATFIGNSANIGTLTTLAKGLGVQVVDVVPDPVADLPKVPVDAAPPEEPVKEPELPSSSPAQAGDEKKSSKSKK